MSAQSLLLLARLCAQHLRADHQITQRTRLALCRNGRQIRDGERQNIGGFITSAIPGVESTALSGSDDGHANLTTDRPST